MRQIPWNLCTTFAAIGLGIAYFVLVTMLGFHWVYVPGALAGLLTAYAISTPLGSWALRAQLGRSLILSLMTGVGVALATLIVGALAIGLSNFVVETIGGLMRAPAGQPFWNALAEIAPDNARSFVAPAVLAGLLYGFLPAATLGLLYGGLLRQRFDDGTVTKRRLPKTILTVTVTASMIVVLLAIVPVGLRSGFFVTTARPDDLTVALGGCGETGMSRGVLAYCRGYPCAQGQCDWEIEQDVFAIYVEPPAGRGWKWVGGGLGTGRGPGQFEHNLYWVQPDSDGVFTESSPRRHTKYEMHFDGEEIEIGRQRFPLEPGMLLVIQFDEAWSYTAGVGHDGLMRTDVSVDQLQNAFDQMCAASTSCVTAFEIKAGTANGLETKD